MIHPKDAFFRIHIQGLIPNGSSTLLKWCICSSLDKL